MLKLLDSDFFKRTFVVGLSVLLTLFVQGFRLLRNSDSTPITQNTLFGLLLLWLFAVVGILIKYLMQFIPLNIIRGFPVLGWVSIVSLLACLVNPIFVRAINAVDFLSLTTSVLAFAGISMSKDLVAMRKLSWRIFIVAICVFGGMYLMDTVVSQLALIAATR